MKALKQFKVVEEERSVKIYYIDAESEEQAEEMFHSGELLPDEKEDAFYEWTIEDAGEE